MEGNGFTREFFRQFAAHKKVRMHEVGTSFVGLRELIRNEMWKEVLKLCSSNEDKFLLSYAIALQQINVSDTARLLLERKVKKDKHSFSLRLMKGYLLKPHDKSIKFLFALLFEIGRELLARHRGKKFEQLYKNAKDGKTLFFTDKNAMNGFQKEKEKVKTSSGTPKKHSKIQPLGSGPGGEEKKKLVMEMKDNSTDTKGSHGGTTGDKKEFSLDILFMRERRCLFYIIDKYILANQTPCAVQLLERYIKKRQKASKLYTVLGMLYLYQGQMKECKKAFSLVGNNTQKKINSSYLMFCEEKYSEACSLLGEVFKKYPQDVAVVNNLAIYHLYNKNISQSVLLLENLIKLDPKKFLDELLVKNLVIFYSLTNMTTKKKLLYELVMKFKGENFPISILK